MKIGILKTFLITFETRFGRRTVLLCSFFLMPIVRLTNVYTPKYFILFLVGSFLAGTAFPMSYIILFALVAEFVDEGEVKLQKAHGLAPVGL